jgi:hypothetical protein
MLRSPLLSLKIALGTRGLARQHARHWLGWPTICEGTSKIAVVSSHPLEYPLQIVHAGDNPKRAVSGRGQL